MRRPNPESASSRLPLLALVLLSGLLAFGSVLPLPWAATVATADAPAPTIATQPATRSGLRLHFASLDGQTGLEGSAFLLFSSRRISLDTPPSMCGNGHVVRAEARGSRGEGTVTVDTAELRSGGAVSGSFSWTATRQGVPFPMRGEFNLTLP